jgi:carbon-monoxide dehydrogenase large subunit
MTEDAFHGRREDQRMLTGAGRYTSDFNFAGQLYAAFVRADRAHAKILSVDASAAREAPGVVAVYTGADLAPQNYATLQTLIHYKGVGGQTIKVPPRPVLATGKVCYVGEEVAMVIATTALAAQDAAEQIFADYEELPAIAHPHDALAADAPQIHDAVPGNVCFEFDYGDAAATAAVIAGAKHVTKIELSSQRVAANPMEPRAFVVSHDAATGHYDLYVPNQGVYMMRGGLAAITGIDEELLRIHPLDVGGGFGVRSTPYQEYPALMHAAKTLGKPIKWIASRSECFATDNHGRAVELKAELALDANGKFLAIRTDWICDQGAYLTPAGPLTNTTNGMLAITGCYQIPVAYGHNRCVLTNTSPTGPYRGAARPDMAYLIERLVDQAAVETGIDRIELRRRNIIPKEAFPYTGPTKSTYDSADFPGMIARALKESDWEGFAARKAQSAAKGKLRGQGCAIFLEPSGGGSMPLDRVSLRWVGDRLQLFAVTQSQGQGHETVFPEIVAGVLGIPAASIDLLAGDIEGIKGLAGSGVIGSRSTMAHGSAFKRAALAVVDKGQELAAEKLETAAADIEFKDGAYTIKGTDRRVSLIDLAREHKAADGSANPLDALGEQAMARAFPSGMHVAEIEIDPDTGVTEIKSYVAVDDVGVVINHTLVQAQVHGGVEQGAGQVFGEHANYDRATGQLLNASFMDYTMPRADLVPVIADHYHLTPSPTNFLGAKGVGEAGTTGSLPTLMNAIVDALRPLGVKQFDMPATSDRVWEAMQQAKG